MAVLSVLQADNAEDFKTLKSRSIRVTRFDAGLRQLAEDMVETMRATNGVGLAAPQVGILRRLIAIEEPAEVEELEDGTTHELRPAQLYVMVNPQIVEGSQEQFAMLEGCLSLPGRYGEVERPAWVTIKYQDLQGREHRIRHADARGYLVGRIVQHEIDHLDGALFTERVTDLSTLRDYREEEPPRRRWLRRRAEPLSATHPDAE